ncbi:MAG: SAM-dependent methyltransferase [Actinobacteria bacterium HGW-Actinobacteria-6]|jgi:SAM-dependent methyltransferase|nr:MAG: SAM-dependent methyltransferase [Actinobacteria bacterium HGW-Actinobacteria-6]
MNCRSCNAPLTEVFVDLGMSPLSNAYIRADQLGAPEVFFPLDVRVCSECFLVQLPEYEAPDVIFGDYAYFSSYSDSWLKHASEYVSMITPRLGLGPQSHVVEIASNDGYLLQYFVDIGVPVLGIEPADSVAQAAIKKGIPTIVEFFGESLGRRLASEGQLADLVIGNNVLAHVPNLNDFVAGVKALLTPTGVATFEFPHLLHLVDRLEFDTIYHEHFSYFSFITVRSVFERHGLTLFDVEELESHGGSLRIYAKHTEDRSKDVLAAVEGLIDRERAAGFDSIETYRGFQPLVEAAKREILAFLIQAKNEGKRVVGYGAPAKGNTLLNYCGVRTDLIEYTVDRNPHKRDKFLPGTHIPVYAPEKIFEDQPDYVMVLPWNLKEEIIGQNLGIAEWGGRFVLPLPRVEVL